MGCSHDNGCYAISKKYDSDGEEIEKSLTDGMNEINEIIDILNGFDIPPEDYLGQKIIENIKEINQNLSDDNEEISNVITDIKNFTAEESALHMKHYNDWVENNKEGKLEN